MNYAEFLEKLKSSKFKVKGKSFAFKDFGEWSIAFIRMLGRFQRKNTVCFVICARPKNAKGLEMEIGNESTKPHDYPFKLTPDEITESLKYVTKLNYKMEYLEMDKDWSRNFDLITKDLPRFLKEISVSTFKQQLRSKDELFYIEKIWLDDENLQMNKISKFLQTKIDDGDFPSAVYLVAEKSEIKLQDALGWAVVEPKRIEATMETIYDLASLTKVLVTGLLCAKLIENGEISLSDKISKFFPEFDTDEKREITIQKLLTHTSGFKGWLPFYLIKDSKFQISKVIADEKLENPLNTKVVYSDLNFLLLGFLIEKALGMSLNKIAKAKIFEPLNLDRTFFNPPKSLQKEIAASEKGNAFEKQTCEELGFLRSSAHADVTDKKSQLRNQIIWGEVHDNNCFFMSGVSGHAGLFSNAFETFRIAQQFLTDSTEILKPETCELFRTNFTKGLNQARSIGFQLAQTPDSTASEALNKDSFGHLGFTGTSVWIEPSSERIFILLTNRTHNRELPLADLKETRQNFHRLATEILDGK